MIVVHVCMRSFAGTLVPMFIAVIPNYYSRSHIKYKQQCAIWVTK